MVGQASLPQYSGPSLKGHPRERTPLEKGHNGLATSAMSTSDAPINSQNDTSDCNRTELFGRRCVFWEEDYCMYLYEKEV